MTSDVKLLPLPETLLRSGFKSSIEVFARACIEADRKARADDGEADTASFIRYMLGPFNDDTRTVHSLLADVVLIARGDADAKKAPPDDVARLVEAAAQALRYVPEPTGSNVQRDWKKKQTRDALAAAIAPFTATQQEGHTNG